MAQKRFNIYKKSSKPCFLSLSRPRGAPQTRATASFPEVKNAFSLHLASISDEKSAWDTVKHVVLKFSETLKPCILRVEMKFFYRVKRPNGRKNMNFNEKAMLAFEKRDFR